MMNGFWFRSDIFGLLPGEEDETNPGRYGKSLALWLKGRLGAEGVTVESVMAEDWGWCVVVQQKPYRLWVGCGNTIDFDENQQPRKQIVSEITWHCFIAVEIPFFKRVFGRTDTGIDSKRLYDVVHRILLSEPRVHLVEEP